jgi:hypothetical protein
MTGTRRSNYSRTTRRGRWLPGVLGVLATVVVAGGLTPSSAHAQKFINFNSSGTVQATLVFTNQIVPDVYSFFATAGERIRVQTSNNSFDTTLNVIGPDGQLTNLFDDDGGGGTSSRIVFTAIDTGAHIVVVSSFRGNPGGGSYRLTLARGALAGATARAVSLDAERGAYMPEVENPVEEK